MNYVKAEWIKITQFNIPSENIFVLTRIDDKNGVRNEQMLKRVGNLWFGKDGMYVYYAPTHYLKVQ